MHEHGPVEDSGLLGRDLIESPSARFKHRNDLIESADGDDFSRRVGEVADAKLLSRTPALLGNSQAYAKSRAVDIGHPVEVQNQSMVFGAYSGLQCALKFGGAAAVDAAADGRNRGPVLVGIDPLSLPLVRNASLAFRDPQADLDQDALAAHRADRPHPPRRSMRALRISRTKTSRESHRVDTTRSIHQPDPWTSHSSACVEPVLRWDCACLETRFGPARLHARDRSG